MSNVLKITTSINEYNHNRTELARNRLEPNEKMQLDNPATIMETKQAAKEGETNGQGQFGDQSLTKDYRSSLSNFLLQISQATPAVQSFSQMLFENLEFLTDMGSQEVMGQAVEKFLDLIKADNPEMILNALKSQANQSVRYRGVLFDVLRKIFHETDSTELKGKILEFLKRSTDMKTGGHIMENIKNDINIASRYLFQSSKEELAKVTSQLQFGKELKSGDIKQNVTILKEQLLPLLNRQISRTHDRGELRDAASRIATAIARYESGDSTKVEELFKQILEFRTTGKYLKGLDPQKIHALLQQTDFDKAVSKETWNDQLLQIMKESVSGKAGIENKIAFQDMMHSMLLNDSVFMPLLHMVLPLDYNGTKMFTEMWVDPDAEESGGTDDTERAVKMLIKFEIETVGFFDLYLIYKNGKVDMQLDYPDTLPANKQEIRENLNQIMARNGLSFSSLVLEKGVPPIPLTEAFPKLLEKRGTINVKI